MRFGVVVPTYDKYTGEPIRRLIMAAEALGYDSVWFGDHIVVPDYATNILHPRWFDAVTCAIGGMGMTSRLKFGTDVLVAPYRDPILLAKMAATAVELFGDRLMLGMGIGYLKGEFAALGIPPLQRRGAVTDEYLRVIRHLFEATGATSYEGEWVSFKDVHFGPRPATAPPLLIGGNKPSALKRAALLGDGWHPLYTTPQAYADGRRRISEIRDQHGLTGRFIYSYSCAPTSRLLAPGEALPVRPASQGALPADFDYAPPLPRAPDGRLYFTGVAGQLQEDVAAFAAAGVEQLALRFATGSDPHVTPDGCAEQMQAFVEQVAAPLQGL